MTSEPPADAPPHASRQGAKNHLVPAASHRHKSETCKNTPYLINRHHHQPTDMKTTHRTRPTSARAESTLS